MFSAAEMTSEHELQESGNLGETQRNPSLKNGRPENFGSSKDPNLAGTLIFSFQPVKKQVQNAWKCWMFRSPGSLKTSDFGGHRHGRRPRNHPGCAPSTGRPAETASCGRQRLEGNCLTDDIWRFPEGNPHIPIGTKEKQKSGIPGN